MKVAISIPDDVLQAADQLARRMRKSRGQLIRDAVREYVKRHALDDVTEAMNRVCADLGVPKTSSFQANSDHPD